MTANQRQRSSFRKLLLQFLYVVKNDTGLATRIKKTVQAYFLKAVQRMSFPGDCVILPADAAWEDSSKRNT